MEVNDGVSVEEQGQYEEVMKFNSYLSVRYKITLPRAGKPF